MSGAISKILDPVIAAFGGIFGGGDKKKEAPAPAEAPAALEPKIEARADDFANREQTLGQRASTAGAQRSDNYADLLGYVMPKKRSASRAILG
jgi:hypothetical protein